MAIFLDVQQVYRMFQRELPEGAYADGAPSAFFTTASIYSKSSLVEKAYDNMEVIFNNFFPQTANEKQSDWEFKVFGFTLDATLGLAVRRQRVIDKLRTKPGIARNDLLNVIRSVIGDDKDIEIAAWGCEEGGWLIGESELGISTILSGAFLNLVTPFTYPNADLCGDPAQFGISEEDWLAAREGAYTYSVLIYSYSLTANELKEVDRVLTDAEPARSTHVIFDGLDPADRIVQTGV